jgi:predicted dehydrogenase
MITNDKSTITLAFEDGSIGTIHYFSNGGNTFPKERVEVFCNNAVLQLNNYRSLIGYGWPKFKKTKLFQQNKGQKECVKAFIDSISSSVSPISFEELLEVSKISIEISDELNR